jgi:glyoxylase-like metal-dependent hydrolase (beta-lactamase superfamily II)
LRSASAVPFALGLHDLGAGTWVYLQPDGSFGYSNAGLVSGDGASLLVDTLFDLKLTRAMLAAMAPALADHPLRYAVNTHANGDHIFGNQLLPDEIEIWSSVPTLEDFDEYPPQRMVDSQRRNPKSPLNHFDFSGLQLRPPEHTFAGSTRLDVGGRVVELLELGPAHSRGDVAVHVPDARVVFAGDLLFIGVTPVMWAGPLARWSAAIDDLCSLDPVLIVPGHGPVTDVAGARRMQSLLDLLGAELTVRQGRGMTVMEAVEDIGPAPVADLLEPERVVNIADKVYGEIDPAHIPMTGHEFMANMEKLAIAWKSQ